jgi:hypothetical protein
MIIEEYPQASCAELAERGRADTSNALDLAVGEQEACRVLPRGQGSDLRRPCGEGYRRGVLNLQVDPVVQASAEGIPKPRVFFFLILIFFKKR